MDIEKALEDLSKKRPIFHSEADFQHALAWALHDQDTNLEIRLEKCIDGKYIDIWLENKDKVYAIELKYKTRNQKNNDRLVELNHNGEAFILKNQGAQDIARYDFLKDIKRLEELKNFEGKNYAGYAIFLTNEPLYWKEPKKKDTCDKEFRIHDDRVFKEGKTYKWAKQTGKGTKKGRTKPIKLNLGTTLKWKKYSDFAIDEYRKINTFRYLLVEV